MSRIDDLLKANKRKINDIEYDVAGKMNLTETVVLIFCISVLISFFMLLVYNLSLMQTAKSPCELGLMEWEEETYLYCHPCSGCNPSKLYCMKSNCGNLIMEYAKDNCWEFKVKPEKSCPYDGPEIMVVKG